MSETVTRKLLAWGALLVAVTLSVETAAYQRYNDGCQGCHGGFAATPYVSRVSSLTWSDSLHNVHQAQTNNNCDLCHSKGDQKNPFLGSSDASPDGSAGLACSGCHVGNGLRAHHGSTCQGSCHSPSVGDESIIPPYYGGTNINVFDSCNNVSGANEDWDGNGYGLDNDGDGFYDEDDDDCAPAPYCGDGNVDADELCDGNCPVLADCDDTNACTFDSLQGSASTCNAVCQNTDILSCIDDDGCCAPGCTSLNDNDCASVCGNGTVEDGETCDGNCPTSCNDSLVCTSDVLVGLPDDCDVACQYAPIVSCIDGDGCCPDGCTFAKDKDCSASCGNDIVDTGETCDGNCPTLADCDDFDACTTDSLSGSAASCSAECGNQPITSCVHGDGCCAPGCHALNDSDCSPVCQNGVKESGELCDGGCPTSCDDGNVCTTDTLSGDSSTCDAACSFVEITTCIDDDGCCAPGCNNATDNDCAPVCENGITEAGESCDGDCPTSCDDSIACTTDSLSGSSSSCDVLCSSTPISACSSGDGCCPAGCDSTSDSDCSLSCGNGIVEGTETCDGDCPNSCDDGDSCTVDELLGDGAQCSAECFHSAVNACLNDDGCCPSACTQATDNDCSETGGLGGSTGDPPGDGDPAFAGANGEGSDGDSNDAGGCGCRTAASAARPGPKSTTWMLVFGLLGLGLARRRKGAPLHTRS